MTLRPFQIILLGVFVALAVGGLIFFSVYRGSNDKATAYGPRVEIWGTLDGQAMLGVIQRIGESDQGFRVVSYVQKDPRSFHDELANAIAENRGPDAILLSNDLLVPERAKLYPIPYDTRSLRDIKDTYVEGAEIFSLSSGTYGFPFAVDPLVMYWNRDIFSTVGLVSPPTTWETAVSQTVPTIVKISQTSPFALIQSALAFGEYANVSNAREVLLMLLLQAGSPLISETSAGGYITSINQSATDSGRAPAEAAIDFYTQFSNPSRPVYSWNRSIINDREAFLAGELALYFGRGSELSALRAGNPNLNFDAAAVPQGGGASVKKGYGTFYALSPLRSSPNFAGTYLVLNILANSDNAHALADAWGLVPVHRNTLAVGVSDPVRQTMYTTALFVHGFLNPNPAVTEGIIRTMIEDVTSGRISASQSAQDAANRFSQALQI